MRFLLLNSIYIKICQIPPKVQNKFLSVINKKCPNGHLLLLAEKVGLTTLALPSPLIPGGVASISASARHFVPVLFCLFPFKKEFLSVINKKCPNGHLLLLAEKVGFEPTIPLRIYKLSRLAPSTTRTPLHKGLQS